MEQLHQNDQAQAASVGGLVFEDDEHNTHTLQSLNKMRKNRHFCDVILHVRTAVGRCVELLLWRVQHPFAFVMRHIAFSLFNV